MLYLQTIRTERALSQTQLALLAQNGLFQPVISLFEKRRLVPTPAQLSAMAKVLGVPAELLLREVEPTKVQPDIESEAVSR